VPTPSILFFIVSFYYYYYYYYYVTEHIRQAIGEVHLHMRLGVSNPSLQDFLKFFLGLRALLLLVLQCKAKDTRVESPIKLAVVGSKVSKRKKEKKKGVPN
jgi:hypothetical protein